MKHGVPPGPPVPWPVSLGVASLVVGAGGDMANLRLLQRIYGDMFSLPLPYAMKWFTPEGARFKKAVVVGSPELVKQVFAADAETLHAGEQSPLRTVLGRHSLLAIDERRHMEQRRLVLPPFHGERMQVYEGIVEEEAIREIESWPEGRPFRTLEPMTRVTLNVILRAVFGVRSGPLMEELRREVPTAIRIGSRMAGLKPLQRDLGPWSPWGRFERYRRRFQWAVNALVDQARRDPEPERRTDVLSLFARATHEDDGSPMTDEEITDQLSTIVAAGHETTATTLAWAIERLRRHPAVLERLVEEADAGGHELREATIREVQRTRPVIPGCGRYTVKPFELGEYVLPKDTVIAVAAPLLHNDPRNYPNPRAFDPHRFVGTRPNPYTWLPFGGGIRRCPGAAFAHMEMGVALGTILRRLELEPATERGERWRFRGVASAPASGGRAVVHARHRDGQRSAVRGRTGGREALMSTAALGEKVSGTARSSRPSPFRSRATSGCGPLPTS